ncbi:MAG: uroporphyrinogen-III synthase [Bacteroidia bacterium]|nr:uroporphyrinogen-III synthase [Bacteroidia bacterium]
MNADIHIVSTKVLSPELIQYMESVGLTVTQADFIRKTILIPDNIDRLSLHPAIVLTSKTAVHAWMEIVKCLKLDVKQYPVYCLALATKTLCIQYGLRIAGVATDAYSLADEILKDKSVTAVTFVCGNLRRDELPDKLKEKGIMVHEIEAYQTEQSPVKIEQAYKGVLFFSPSAVDSFLSLNPTKSIACFCLGNTTGNHAREFGFAEVHVAEAHTPEALVKKVIQHFKNKVNA